MDVIDFQEQSQCGESLDSSETTEGFTSLSVGFGTAKEFEFCIEGTCLGLKIFEVFKFDGKGCLERALERLAKVGEPLTMLLGPGGSSLTEDMAVIAKHA